ncbi:hypothetical protein LEMA_P110940.1 [Plenodomus lingam JN3]|uniref:Alpha/beta hydrolase fold-3 domain-containing protein n=1 Tax=Leptosphaeria maculans (strain JN3 / isolate v23.1.3 / race Av1-4-5-6-7-8) TaxID=985895 RepID=E4ZXT0_LEPMJ|nr:hypothetical protein LEMA_P110940.1 [Plenodomus lingam JN3]CBX96175.1 hypothetical protein LEMA_P110940.1 [Plenodomus lingam JN3]
MPPPTLLQTHISRALRLLDRRLCRPCRRCCCCCCCCYLRPRTTRPYSAVTAAPPRTEHFEVPCRSNGSITIEKASPILIYLPPGPVLPGHAEEEEHIMSSLAASSAATIARINYRASVAHPYPTPFHDVVTGYDWIVDNLLRDEFHRPHLGRLGVCGQLVGGSLATMLALTECRVGENRLAAAAVNNPIVDWVFPDELPSVGASELPEPSGADDTAFPADVESAIPQPLTASIRKQNKPATKKPSLTAWQAHGDNATIPTLTLSAERDMLFRRPGDYFDRFASPIHFFRSPHAHMIFPEQDDMSASQQPEDLLDREAQFALNHHASAAGKTKASPVVATLSRCRAYARNYPPAGSFLKLPVWHITTGLQSPLSDQALDLAKGVQRSLARQRLKSQSGRTRWLDAAEKKVYEQWAQEQVQLQSQQGIGLWSPSDKDEDENWTAPVTRVGIWMKQRLETDFVRKGTMCPRPK